MHNFSDQVVIVSGATGNLSANPGLWIKLMFESLSA